MYHVVPMSEAYAREIACWQYPDEYTIYSFQPDEELLAELLDGSYYACLDGAGTSPGKNADYRLLSMNHDKSSHCNRPAVPVSDRTPAMPVEFYHQLPA